MNSYAVSVALCASLLACAKSDQPPTKTDTTKPSAPAAPIIADSTTKPTPDTKTDSAATVSAAVSAPKPPSSAANDPPPTGPSTRVGVYTNEQANRGKQVYAGSCRSCHSPTSHTGQVFVDWWQNKRLSDLYNYIASQMPKNDPGTLAPEDVADVVAYLLKMNDMPTGKAELYPDADSLKKFWIDARHSK
jgi:hypothetical protein